MPSDICTLQAQIAERMAFLKKVVEFAEMIVNKRGVSVRYSEHSAHTRIIRELKDFANFSFRTDMGKTMYGGNEVVVTESYRPAGTRTVLQFEWQTSFSDECVVTGYAGDEYSAGWENRLLDLMQNYEEIAAMIDREKNQDKQQQVLLSEEEHQRVALEATAKRLRLL